MAAFAPDREIDTVEVPTIGIGDLIGTGLDFMKVDIQGHEHAVFGDYPDLLARVGASVFEITFLDAGVFELMEILRRTYNQHEVLSPVLFGADVLFWRE